MWLWLWSCGRQTPSIRSTANGQGHAGGPMDARTRLGWVRLYEQLGDAGKVCRRCGISRPTLRKWWRRYQADGVAGLKDESRRPRHLAKQKVFADQEALVLDLRRSRHLGIKQLRSELLRQHGLGCRSTRCIASWSATASSI